jgi:DNA-binding NtrC family response regulator
MSRILLVDDDPEFAGQLRDCLGEQGHAIHCLDQAEEGLRLLAADEPFDLVLVDNKMPRMSGLDFLAALQKTEVSTPVVLMTGSHNDRTAIQATNLGAFAYVIKPLNEEEILAEFAPVIREALEITRRPPPVALPHRAEPADEDDSVIVGRSRAILDVLKRVAKLAELDETVLILGETGTGKDLVAQAIHTNSRRRNKPFVVMNCAALNESLLDDELFGHEAGAFTGGDKLRKGRFEHAQGGTLFLDEVGDMPPALQVKLLRVLENREVVRIGNNEPIRVDVRVVAATFRDLGALVREGKFRQDLFYRLEGMTIRLPPLRERKGDIELLARRFLTRMFGGSSSAPTLHPDALRRLCDHHWEGNVRQLQKVLCRAVGVCRCSVIMPEDLDFGNLDARTPPSPAPASDEASAEAGLRNLVAWAWESEQGDLWPLLQGKLECELLRHALAQDGLSQVQLARRLGIARNTLRARLEQYGLQAPTVES